MDILGIILTILFGIFGIAVSLYCWRHNYEKQKEHNKIIDALNAIDFNDRYSFATLISIINEVDEKDIDISNYFNKDSKKYNDGKISKNQIMSSIYDLYQKTKETNKKGK